MLMDADAPFLPQEIITNILKRLPVKSLLRFRCVCKQWKNLIKTSSFIADHLQHSRNQNPQLIWHRTEVRGCRPLHMLDYKSRVFQVLPSPSMSPRTRIVGSCNGLLCVKFYRKFPSLPFLILWNPATREAWEIPEPINNINNDFGVGFGFSSSVNDYKIVISGATQFFRDEYIRVEVYSLSTGTWKEVKVGNFGGVGFCKDHPPVTTNGAIFWFGCQPCECKTKDYDWMIISFDIAMEVFSLISLPVGDGEEGYEFDSCDKLTVYENKVAILSRAVIGNYKSFVIDLWVMEEDAGTSGERWGWSKIFTTSTFFNAVPCCIWSDEIVFEAVHHKPKSFMPKFGMMPKYDETALYMLNLNTLRRNKFATCRLGHCVSVISNHVESLVPIGNIQAEEP